MTLKCPYSTAQMYNEWISGTPISEIINKTGINRKTWNKRFERYEKQLKMATKDNTVVNNGDKSQIIPTTTNNLGNQTRANKFVAALAVISFMFALYFVYAQIRKHRANQ